MLLSFLQSLGLGFAGPLAVTTMTATIAAGFVIARLAGTRARAEARERVRDFEFGVGEFLAGRLRGRDLLGTASHLAPDDFWDSIFRLRAQLTRRGLQDLESALERSRHVLAERRALRDSDQARRDTAARRLAILGAARHRRALRRAMVAGPEPVTLAAGTALARIRDGASLIWILDHPDRLAHRTARARIALLRAFGRGAAPRLQTALERGLAEPRMERAVIEALAEANHRAAIEPVARRLTHEWRDSRVAAARALGRLGAVEHRDALARALEDEDWRVRAQAARSLGRLDARAAIPALRRALSDTGWWVRRHAAYALAAMGDEGRDVLRAAADDDADPYARDIAAEALAGGFPPPAK